MKKKILALFFVLTAILPSSAFAAIAYDNGAFVENAVGSTVTLSHTVAGSQTILWVSVIVAAGDRVTGITYAGISMTQAVKVNTTGTVYHYLYYLVAPTDATNDIVVSLTLSSTITVASASYTGAAQTGVPDASGSATGTGTDGTRTITTVADNSWVVMAPYQTVGGNTTNTASWTKRKGFANGIGDTNAVVTPAGSFAQHVTFSASGIWSVVQASFAPYIAPPPVLNSVAGLVKALWIN